MRRSLAFRLVALSLAMALSGCLSVMEVRADGGKPRLSVWPSGVRIERGSADAVSVRGVVLGAYAGCRTASLGATVASCTVIDPTGCPVAVTSSASPAERKQLGELADQLAGQCPHTKERLK